MWEFWSAIGQSRRTFGLLMGLTLDGTDESFGAGI